MTKQLIIELWADITCPFCYIGETLLKRELEHFEDAKAVKVIWKSALLMPNLPLDKSFTWSERMNEVSDPSVLANYEKKMSVLKHLSEKYGLIYNLESAYSHNSQRAAMLLKAANNRGLTLDLATLFGRGYFSEAKDYSSSNELKATALEAGLSADVIDQVLNGDLYQAEVLEDQKMAERYAPNYVPTLYFNGAGMIEGVLKPEQIRKSIEDAWKNL